MGNQPCCADKTADERSNADLTKVVSDIATAKPLEEQVVNDIAPKVEQKEEPPAAEPEVAAKPEEQQPPQADAAVGMEIEFSDTAGNSVTQTFVRKPLGFKFSNTQPPKVFVTDVQKGSFADEFTVAKDWEIVKVNGKQLELFAEFQEFMGYFKDEHDKLPEPKIDVLFNTAGEDVGLDVLKTFNQKPAGFKFSNTQQPKVFVTEVSPGSPAEALGVAKDWQIVEVNGKSAETGFTDFQGFMDYFTYKHNELQGPKVDVVFMDGDTQVAKTLIKKPLGFKFTNNEPSKVRITAVEEGSHADELGIKVGWELTQINGKQIPSFEDMASLCAYIKEEMGKLQPL